VDGRLLVTWCDYCCLYEWCSCFTIQELMPWLPVLYALCCARIYELYSDYVLKNPFYEVEQVRCPAVMM